MHIQFASFSWRQQCCEEPTFITGFHYEFASSCNIFAQAFIFQKAEPGVERQLGLMRELLRAAAASTYFTPNACRATKEQRTKAISGAPNIYIHYTQAQQTDVPGPRKTLRRCTEGSMEFILNSTSAFAKRKKWPELILLLQWEFAGGWKKGIFFQQNDWITHSCLLAWG